MKTDIRLKRTKPYKAAPPEETVARIQAKLTDLGLPFTEEAILGAAGRFSYCLRIVDDIRGEPVFQTMGKGRTDAYAQASAYGEMAERIQNLAFYMMLMYPSEPETATAERSVPFKYYPDEKPLGGEELRRGLARLFRGHPVAATEPMISIPFWNVFDECTEHLPFRALQVVVGSNGMCSGNTPAEALIHGICEVFERYILKQLFLRPQSLPEIPLEHFVGLGIHEDLCHLAEGSGYEVRVKDCSLGLRLPVLGLLIRDGRGRYAFHLGSDPSPGTALERCLTEMAQGGHILFKKISEAENASGTVHSSAFWRTQLHLNIQCYGGHWPPFLFRKPNKNRFKGFEHPISESDEDDLEHVLGIVADAGWDLLIRDNSFLGIPSYHVYIPDIGEMANVLDNTFVSEHLAFDRHAQVLTNPSAATPGQREAAVQAMRRYAEVAPSRMFRATDYFMCYRGHPFASMQQETLEEFLREPSAAVPACFECAICGSADLCNYAFISSAWSRMKQAMAASEGITQAVQSLPICRRRAR